MTSANFKGSNSGFQVGNNYGSVQYTVEQSSIYRDERVRRFLSLLNTCPYEDRKNRNNRRVPGTCEWFTKHPKFTNWQRCTSHDLAGLLWVSADPGCGKSVLTRYLVDEVLCNEKQTVCYFFFKDDFPDQRNAAGALSAILHQIFVARPQLLSDIVLKKLETDGEKLVQSFHKLWNILMSVSAQEEEARETICILDALDECGDRDELIEAVTMFYQGLHRERKLKFLMTSRPYPHIERLFWKLRTRLPTIHLSGDGEEEVQQISREIGLVISKRVNDIGEQRSLGEDERNLLEQQLTAVENRTYLWVTLTLDVLENMPGFTKGNIRRVVQYLPTTVESAYERILDRSLDKKKAKVLLHIITAAVRPFFLEELSLAWAIHINLDDINLTAISDDLEPKERFRETLRDLCGLFVVVIDEKVYLLHQTAKEFLVQSNKSTVNQSPQVTEWKCSLIPVTSNSILARICISWLPWINAAQRDIERGEFDEYSSCHWITHYHQTNAQDGNVLIMRAQSVCDPSSDVYPVWSKLYADKRYMPTSTSRLLIASFLGLTGVVKLLLATANVNINSKGSGSRAPLSWKKPVMKLLLRRRKVDINTKDSIYGMSSLSWAADNGHEAVVKLLLETKKVDLNSKDSISGKTPLSWAAQNGHEAVVKLLLETKKVDINTKDSDGWTPLFSAVFDGHEAVVKLLLETKKVDINIKDSEGRTPLSWAAEYGHEAVVKLLLETKTVDINTKDSEGRTPLSLAAEYGHEAVVKLLLETKADINIKDSRGRTPLSWAAENGHEAVVKLLLETKADINIKDFEGRTPLSLAAEYGYEAVVNLLQSY
ncbi:hypothetical protein ABHI18_011888 [Aspergillus niger]